VGNYRNAGSDYRPKGSPHRVKVHDFEDKELGKVAPYGIYDVTANLGFVNLGVTSDTARPMLTTFLGCCGHPSHRYKRQIDLAADVRNLCSATVWSLMRNAGD
jgi:Rhodopirellula transposase DDE domain